MLSRQDELKNRVARTACDYVTRVLPPGSVLAVGTGSTVNFFVTALAAARLPLRGAVSSSEATTARLTEAGIEVLDPNTLDEDFALYVDGADEIDSRGYMIKGGGAALTREKILAARCREFVCIADQSKAVSVLGRFPVPIEVIPMAANHIARRFSAGEAAGAAGSPVARVRHGAHGGPLVTDNGQHILDVRGLQIHDPLAFESCVNNWPGVVTVGVFAHQRAHRSLLASETGVTETEYPGA